MVELLRLTAEWAGAILSPCNDDDIACPLAGGNRALFDGKAF
jgi:hypothetical protein